MTEFVAVAKCFTEVSDLYGFARFQVGNSSGHFQDAMDGSCGKIHSLAGPLEQLFLISLQWTVPLELLTAQLAVKHIVSLPLFVSGQCDPLSHHVTAFTFRVALHELLARQGRHIYLKVYAVQ